MWNLECLSKECKSKHVLERPITPKNGHYFQVNRAFVLALRSVGRGHSSAKKITSILNLNKPINSNHWKKHSTVISEKCEDLMEQNLKKEADTAKSYCQKISPNIVLVLINLVLI